MRKATALILFIHAISFAGLCRQLGNWGYAALAVLSVVAGGMLLIEDRT
jgi:hypothetical protein